MVIEKQSTFDRLEVFREYYNKIVEKDDDKERFKVILNTLINLYDASKPEIFEKDWHNDRFPALLYLYGLFHKFWTEVYPRVIPLRIRWRRIRHNMLFMEPR